jgi:hypothetical protein
MMEANIPKVMAATIRERALSDLGTTVIFDQKSDRMLPAKRFGSKRRQQPGAFLCG